jgi:hypothetical protein
MSDYTLDTGKHPRRYCPIVLPLEAVGPCDLIIGEARVPAQPVEGGLCAILPDAPAQTRLPVRLAPAEAPRGEVRLSDTGGVLDIAIDGRPFSAYHYAGEGNRPFLYPVLGPNDANLVRSFPMRKDVPGETSDHPHHRGIWTANGDVNGLDNWHEGPERARMEHITFTEVVSGPVFGGFVEELHWLSPKGALLCRETRTVRIYHTPTEHRLFDWGITLDACAGAIRMGDTKEGGMLSVRVATSMDGVRGGAIENAWGGIGEAECWGKAAPWCDYSGQVDGTHAGIAVFDAPGNPRFPTTWHVRDYGLMGANIFGQRAFQGNDWAVSGDLVMQAGATLGFRYRVMLHAGDAGDASVGARYFDFAFPPKGQAG